MIALFFFLFFFNIFIHSFGAPAVGPCCLPRLPDRALPARVIIIMERGKARSAHPAMRNTVPQSVHSSDFFSALPVS
ncbi:hypothetical protein DFJ77DRAFT_198599 [Powellomyces hirtus]|nr:hypothetical protein DFJ77DRAFT_198599 [Powellomyces hirtus]